MLFRDENFFSLNPKKGIQALEEASSHTENFSNMNYLNFFIFLATILAFLDPDPPTYLNLDLNRIRNGYH
jgi:hypothetical protein